MHAETKADFVTESAAATIAAAPTPDRSFATSDELLRGNQLVSFIIPALNEERFLEQAIESVKKQAGSNTEIEIIVVDCFSTDRTPEIARALGCRLVRTAPGNISRARNLGASAAKGGILVFLDADCELPTGWLRQIRDCLLNLDVVGAGATLALPSEGRTWVQETWFALTHQGASEEQDKSTRWLPSFNLAVTASAFAEIGGFNEELTTCEDVDLSYRLRSHGKLMTVGRVPVVHHGESRNVAEFFRREAWRARGTRQTLSRHWREPREVVSALLPVLSVLWKCGLAVFAVLCAIRAETPPLTYLRSLLWLLPVIILIPEFCAAVRAGMRFLFSPRALLLMTVYMGARCWGTLRSARRVGR